MIAKLIFDNGGGTTLQIGAYAHRHIRPLTAARDVLLWLAGSPVDEWDDHDPDVMDEPSSEDIRNGRYLMTTVDSDDPQLPVVIADLKSTGWANAFQVAAHIAIGDLSVLQELQAYQNKAAREGWDTDLSYISPPVVEHPVAGAA